jgi:hypothetical protein
MVGLTGREDGRGLFPSVDYLAWLLGVNRRTVQRQMSALRDLKIIEPETGARGGRGLTPGYRFLAGNLPRRPSWAEERVTRVSPFSAPERAAFTTPKGRHFVTERAALCHPIVVKGLTKDDVGGARLPQRKRNEFARAPEADRKAPNRLLEAIEIVDTSMRRSGVSFDEAIASLNARPEFCDRHRGEDFIGTVVYYFKERRGLELAGKARA